MKRKLAASPVNLYVTAAVAAVVGTLSVPAPASAVTITDLFVFGDSYSDTGAFFPLTNGSTAVGYLAKNFNITLTTPQIRALQSSCRSFRPNFRMRCSV
jgi:phospholipase/lecithinase/hemolysin